MKLKGRILRRLLLTTVCVVSLSGCFDKGYIYSGNYSVYVYLHPQSHEVAEYAASIFLKWEQAYDKPWGGRGRRVTIDSRGYVPSACTPANNCYLGREIYRCLIEDCNIPETGLDNPPDLPLRGPLYLGNSHKLDLYGRDTYESMFEATGKFWYWEVTDILYDGERCGLYFEGTETRVVHWAFSYINGNTTVSPEVPTSGLFSMADSQIQQWGCQDMFKPAGDIPLPREDWPDHVPGQ